MQSKKISNEFQKNIESICRGFGSETLAHNLPDIISVFEEVRSQTLLSKLYEQFPEIDPAAKNRFSYSTRLLGSVTLFNHLKNNPIFNKLLDKSELDEIEVLNFSQTLEELKTTFIESNIDREKHLIGYSGEPLNGYLDLNFARGIEDSTYFLQSLAQESLHSENPYGTLELPVTAASITALIKNNTVKRDQFDIYYSNDTYDSFNRREEFTWICGDGYYTLSSVQDYKTKQYAYELKKNGKVLEFSKRKLKDFVEQARSKSDQLKVENIESIRLGAQSTIDALLTKTSARTAENWFDPYLDTSWYDSGKYISVNGYTVTVSPANSAGSMTSVLVECSTKQPMLKNEQLKWAFPGSVAQSEYLEMDEKVQTLVERITNMRAQALELLNNANQSKTLLPYEEKIIAQVQSSELKNWDYDDQFPFYRYGEKETPIFSFDLKCQTETLIVSFNRTKDCSEFDKPFRTKITASLNGADW